jgi:sulfite reductase beta subunit-like hemoprotein
MQEGDIIARLQNHHRVSIFALNADLAFKAVNTDSHLSRLLSGPDIVSCPGSTYCKHALVNTQAVEAELRREIPESETRSIRISGCPNGCAHSAVADIGFTGRIQKDEKGNRVEGFHVFKGGGMGRTQALAENHTPFVPSGEVADLILKS